ncbi:MAG TPA: carboxymuconolactone decarboxylase family protein [Pirellulales bacterium]|nr:carboxymuconolactone decarboxylase family protein [Pirellulales bacterium]
MTKSGEDSHAHQARVRPSRPRIEPALESELTDEQRAILNERAKAGRLVNIHYTVVRHPNLARDWLAFAGHVSRRNTLEPREREILILRIGWLCASEYEWAQHVRIGKREGLTDENIRQIAAGPECAEASPGDRLLMQAADELHRDACVSETTWNALAATHSEHQMMDLVFTVGEYNLVSMALNCFGVQLDEGLEGFPK